MPEDWRGWKHLGYIDDLKLKVMYRWQGVYAVRLIEAQSEKPIPIGRFLAIDEKGILLIGTSNDVGGRLGKFYHSYLEDARTHSEGRRLHLVRMLSRFEEEIYPGASMQFNVKRISDKEHAKNEEEKLLKSYFVRFGELPPLNSAVGKKRVLWADSGAEADTLW